MLVGSAARSPINDQAFQKALELLDTGGLHNALGQQIVHRRVPQSQPCNVILRQKLREISNWFGTASHHTCPALRKPSRREESVNGRRSAAEVAPVNDAQHGHVPPGTQRKKSVHRSSLNLSDAQLMQKMFLNIVERRQGSGRSMGNPSRIRDLIYVRLYLRFEHHDGFARAEEFLRSQSNHTRQPASVAHW